MVGKNPLIYFQKLQAYNVLDFKNFVMRNLWEPKFNVDSKLLLIQNHLLLILKIYIYYSRISESLRLKSLIRKIMQFKNIEEKISINNKKHTMYKRKWQQVENILWGGGGGKGKAGCVCIRSCFSVTRETGKVGGRRFFYFFIFPLFVIYCL